MNSWAVIVPPLMSLWVLWVFSPIEWHCSYKWQVFAHSWSGFVDATIALFKAMTVSTRYQNSWCRFVSLLLSITFLLTPVFYCFKLIFNLIVLRIMFSGSLSTLSLLIINLWVSQSRFTITIAYFRVKPFAMTMCAILSITIFSVT